MTRRAAWPDPVPPFALSSPLQAPHVAASLNSARPTRPPVFPPRLLSSPASFSGFLCQHHSHKLNVFTVIIHSLNGLHLWHTVYAPIFFKCVEDVAFFLLVSISFVFFQNNNSLQLHSIKVIVEYIYYLLCAQYHFIQNTF